MPINQKNNKNKIGDKKMNFTDGYNQTQKDYIKNEYFNRFTSNDLDASGHRYDSGSEQLYEFDEYNNAYIFCANQIESETHAKLVILADFDNDIYTDLCEYEDIDDSILKTVGELEKAGFTYSADFQKYNDSGQEWAYVWLKWNSGMEEDGFEAYVSDFLSSHDTAIKLN
jgi:hypothetical protein